MSRLIDLDIMGGMFAPCETYTGRDVMALLNQAPIVYNVDKVVEQLVKNSRPWNLQEQFIMLNNAIKIVKAGGTEC